MRVLPRLIPGLPGGANIPSRCLCEWSMTNLVAVAIGSTVAIVDPETEQIAQTLEDSSFRGEPPELITSILWSNAPIPPDPSDEHSVDLIVGDLSGQVVVWDVGQGAIRFRLAPDVEQQPRAKGQPAGSAVIQLAWHPSKAPGTHLVVARQPGTVELWQMRDAPSHAGLGTVPPVSGTGVGATKTMASLPPLSEWAPGDAALLMGPGGDAARQLWKIAHSEPLLCFSFDPFEPELALCGTAGAVAFWKDHSPSPPSPQPGQLRIQRNAQSPSGAGGTSPVQMVHSDIFRGLLYFAMAKEVLLFDGPARQVVSSFTCGSTSSPIAAMHLSAEPLGLQPLRFEAPAAPEGPDGQPPQGGDRPHTPPEGLLGLWAPGGSGVGSPAAGVGSPAATRPRSTRPGRRFGQEPLMIVRHQDGTLVYAALSRRRGEPFCEMDLGRALKRPFDKTIHVLGASVHPFDPTRLATLSSTGLISMWALREAYADPGQAAPAPIAALTLPAGPLPSPGALEEPVPHGPLASRPHFGEAVPCACALGPLRPDMTHVETAPATPPHLALVGSIGLVASTPGCGEVCPFPTGSLGAPLQEGLYKGLPLEMCLLAGTQSGSLVLYDLLHRRVHAEYGAHQAPVRIVRWLSPTWVLSYAWKGPDGAKRYLNELLLTDLVTGAHRNLLQGRPGIEETLVRTVRLSGPMEVWDLARERVLHSIRLAIQLTAIEWFAPTNPAPPLADGAFYFFTVDEEGIHRNPRTLNIGTGVISCITWREDVLACGDVAGQLHVFDPKRQRNSAMTLLSWPAGQPVASSFGSRAHPAAKPSDRQGGQVESSPRMGVSGLGCLVGLCLWGGCLAGGSGAMVKQVRISPGTTVALVLLDGGQVGVWDFAKQELLSPAVRKLAAVEVAWLLPGTPLAVSADGAVRVFDVTLSTATSAFLPTALARPMRSPALLPFGGLLFLRAALHCGPMAAPPSPSEAPGGGESELLPGLAAMAAMAAGGSEPGVHTAEDPDLEPETGAPERATPTALTVITERLHLRPDPAYADRLAMLDGAPLLRHLHRERRSAALQAVAFPGTPPPTPPPPRTGEPAPDGQAEDGQPEEAEEGPEVAQNGPGVRHYVAWGRAVPDERRPEVIRALCLRGLEAATYCGDAEGRHFWLLAHYYLAKYRALAGLAGPQLQAACFSVPDRPFAPPPESSPAMREVAPFFTLVAQPLPSRPRSPARPADGGPSELEAAMAGSAPAPPTVARDMLLVSPAHESFLPRPHLPLGLGYYRDGTHIRQELAETARMRRALPPTYDMTQAYVHTQVALGHADEAVRVLFETDPFGAAPDGRPHFHEDVLRACVLAAATTPDRFRQTMLEAADLLASRSPNDLDLSVELLCAVRHYSQAAALLWRAGRYEEAITLAKVVRFGFGYAWAAMLKGPANRPHLGLRVYLSLGDVGGALQVLVEQHQVDAAALFLEAAAAAGLLEVHLVNRGHLGGIRSLIEYVYANRKRTLGVGKRPPIRPTSDVPEEDADREAPVP
ncbi:hypothetical protein PAPYR_4101 [Paratrimastix pyriformis]|uniref:Uncharacterized protein n=1 Tax=Paratrimastix pyriformis TaxID=342808 RepID=A0ABQ8UKH2_9EUKA|nr:hypothetical protein PAPYR_4101 [Paratrimastix pyriformis]